MLLVTVPAEELNAAGKIANVANLVDIRLRSVNVSDTNLDSFFDGNDQSEINLSINHKSEKRELVSGKSLTALVTVDVMLAKQDASVNFHVEYLVTYQLPATPIPETVPETMFDAFAKNNGLLNCWPYVRSQLNNLSSEMGIPVVLPLLRIKAKKPDTPKGNELDQPVKAEVK